MDRSLVSITIHIASASFILSLGQVWGFPVNASKDLGQILPRRSLYMKNKYKQRDKEAWRIREADPIRSNHAWNHAWNSRVKPCVKFLRSPNLTEKANLISSEHFNTSLNIVTNPIDTNYEYKLLCLVNKSWNWRFCHFFPEKPYNKGHYLLKFLIWRITNYLGKSLRLQKLQKMLIFPAWPYL